MRDKITVTGDSVVIRSKIERPDGRSEQGTIRLPLRQGYELGTELRDKIEAAVDSRHPVRP